ncbi:glycosyltransferase [Novosphingobium sp. AP12]|nr:glycosyltransferase [Novosphingobium sp. AP12]
MKRMREMIAASDLESEVEMVDWLSEADMQQALRDADVLVHLSAIDSFPLIVLEALACGTLPIIRNMAGAKHMVTKLGGHVVANARAVADACEWISSLDKESLREQQAQARIRTRATYGWPTVVSALSATFEQTLK